MTECSQSAFDFKRHFRAGAALLDVLTGKTKMNEPRTARAP